MLGIALVAPEIPPNTGSIMRLAANVGAELALIEPLGFALDDAKLRRAGLDYRHLARTTVFANYAAFAAALGGRRVLAFSARGVRRHDQAAYRQDDVLLFGCESAGLPASLLATFAPAHRLRIPMRPGSRSLNLANAAAVAVYEAWRQLGFEGAAPPSPRAPAPGQR